jgi:hypothetical protein
MTMRELLQELGVLSTKPPLRLSPKTYSALSLASLLLGAGFIITNEVGVGIFVLVMGVVMAGLAVMVAKGGGDR